LGRRQHFLVPLPRLLGQGRILIGMPASYGDAPAGRAGSARRRDHTQYRNSPKHGQTLWHCVFFAILNQMSVPSLALAS
jgi:hypothetical protein